MKTNILIKEENMGRIEKVIDEVESRARTRLITASTIFREIKELENKLPCAKKYMEGVVAWVDVHAQVFPGSYRGTPESTHFCVKKVKAGWKLIGVCRSTCGNTLYKLELPETTENEILNFYRYELF